MNGHLQLSISLKNYTEIDDAIKLLQSLLPKPPSVLATTKEIEEYKNTLPAGKFTTAPTIEKMDIECDSPSKYGKLGMKEMMGKSVNVIKKLKKAKIKTKLSKNEKKTLDTIDAVRMSLLNYREKQRQKALKRKRDKHGHFLKEKK